jgi:hypothetical protein
VAINAVTNEIEISMEIALIDKKGTKTNAAIQEPAALPEEVRIETAVCKTEGSLNVRMTP